VKAVHLYEFGPAENLRIVDVPIPRPGEGEVLIKAGAASINFPDILMRRGSYIYPPSTFPFIPGREMAGVIAEVGSKVTNFKPGMRVTAHMNTGGYAEYAAVPIKNIVCLPDRVSFLQGLVYQINLRLAYLLYYPVGRIGPTETVLLHAAAGAIGTLLIHIAKRRGKNVIIALSSSDDKLEYCRANGADYLINYRKSDYVEEVLRITGGKGVDVSLNSVAGSTLDTDPRAIKPLGRWVIFGHAGGKGLIDPYGEALRKTLTVTFFTVYSVLEREEFRQATDFLENWLHTEDLISVTKTFRLEEIVEAHRELEVQRTHGKIAIVMETGE
jgi:NADPH2:quinone reductase